MPNAEEWFQTGMQLVAGKKLFEAVNSFERCLMVNPKHAAAWANRGAILLELGNSFDAVLNFNQSLAIKEEAGAVNNRGVAWQDLGSYNNSFADYRRALQMDPALILPSNNIGNLLSKIGEIRQARDQFTKSLEVEPEHCESRMYRAMMDLSLGDFETGWEDFEARFKSGQIPLRFFEGKNGRIPPWNGEDLDGKALFFYGEQGLGDMVQFIRLAKVIKDRWPAAYVGVEVNLSLVRLLRNVEGVDEILSFGDEIKHDYDFACPMISAARVLKIRFDSIPAQHQYVYPDPYRVKVWKRDLTEYKKMYGGNRLIGLCWSGLSRPLMPHANKIDARRSTDLATFAPLFQVPGVTFVSLQHGGRADQSKTPPPFAPILDNTDQFHDFQDTASLMANLDLVITVDTAVAHVSAAMGIPTWVLSRFDACWRWHYGRDPKAKSSPWYPSVTLFRQSEPADWSGMMREVAAALRVFLDQHRASKREMVDGVEVRMEIPDAFKLNGGHEPLTMAAE
jgi:tetratricopeptide (TPR) repeat protein